MLIKALLKLLGYLRIAERAVVWREHVKYAVGMRIAYHDAEVMQRQARIYLMQCIRCEFAQLVYTRRISARAGRHAGASGGRYG